MLVNGGQAGSSPGRLHLDITWRRHPRRYCPRPARPSRRVVVANVTTRPVEVAWRLSSGEGGSSRAERAGWRVGGHGVHAWRARVMGKGEGLGGERASKSSLQAPEAGGPGSTLAVSKGCPGRQWWGPEVGLGAAEGPIGPLMTGWRARGVTARRASVIFFEAANDGQDDGPQKKSLEAPKSDRGLVRDHRRITVRISTNTAARTTAPAQVGRA